MPKKTITVNPKVKTIYATIIAGIVVIIFVSLITIIADLNPPIKNWLKNTFSHHWVGKGMLSVMIFIVISGILSIAPINVSKKLLEKSLWLLFWSAVIGTIAIFGFYVIETFILH